MTLADADLERLLSIAAGEYIVPDDGIDRILALEADQRHENSRLARIERWRPTSGQLVAAASIVVVAAFGFGVTQLGGNHDSAKSASASAFSSAGGTTANSDKTTNSDKTLGTTSTSASGSATESHSSKVGGATAGEAAPALAPAPAPSATAGPIAGGAEKTVTSQAPDLIRTGHATLTVRKGGVPAAQTKLEDLAASDNGLVAKEDTTGGPNPTATLTLRVPGDEYQDLIDGVRVLGTVTDLSTQTTDVTSQYTDLAARIKALQATRDTYLTILSKATSIGDTLSVQQRLDDVQSQLEQLQGQQKVLSDQTSLGTLEVTVGEKAAVVAPPVKPHQNGPWERSWLSARHHFADGVRGLVVASGPIAFALMLAAVGLLGWRVGRRFWRRAQV